MTKVVGFEKLDPSFSVSKLEEQTNTFSFEITIEPRFQTFKELSNVVICLLAITKPRQCHPVWHQNIKKRVNNPQNYFLIIHSSLVYCPSEIITVIGFIQGDGRSVHADWKLKSILHFSSRPTACKVWPKYQDLDNYARFGKAGVGGHSTNRHHLGIYLSRWREEHLRGVYYAWVVKSCH